ncbi:hypothetical protein BIV25_22505 [Streptomyces sp. MUSC 14]|uniref:hypothetical protein n=1 Tax=Streptomyces sp. MUSC 14 TaxID=1354889 RepID=UPI0008F5CD1B|nr:hypothetical protein [Streptomyces sp. MUSC 14]OIJ94378.1 hypothetical protein BIV25_22505 [Streptomyces sp. MUSC 14]
MQWTNGSGEAHGRDLYGEAPYGGVEQLVPFVPMPQPEPAPEHWSGSGAQPVFVDASGRRRRRVLRAARLLALPAGGYVALLIGTVLGGPGVSAPFVPQPDSAHPATPPVTVPDSASGTASSARSEGSTTRKAASGPVTPVARSGATPAHARTGSPASGTTVTPSRTPVAPHSSKGRARGASHKPVK